MGIDRQRARRTSEKDITTVPKIRLTLNKKCEFGIKEVTYIGHKLTPDGVKPDEQKVTAIKEMPPPEDRKGVERLIGTVNYT